MIRLDNWRVTLEVGDRELGYESDHLHRRLEIAADLDAGWAVKLDMALGKAKNVVDLERTGDVLWVDLTRDILASDGLYRCQLRGLKGDTVAHSNQFELLVSGSINAAEAFPSVEPSELAQMEARVTQAKADAVAAADRAEAAAVHPPKLSEDQTWMVWGPGERGVSGYRRLLRRGGPQHWARRELGRRRRGYRRIGDGSQRRTGTYRSRWSPRREGRSRRTGTSGAQGRHRGARPAGAEGRYRRPGIARPKRRPGGTGHPRPAGAQR